MQIFKTNILVLFFLLVPVTHAKIIGKMIKVRGNVSVLPPHTVDALTGKAGMDIKEETSISTSDNSIAVIEYKDKSKVVIGPNSMAVIKPATKEKSGIVGLLKGKLKANIKKRVSRKRRINQNHFYIQTRTASMGVRGTDFQSTYNPINGSSSLLTYEGEVAIAKVDPKEVVKAVAKLKEKNPSRVINVKKILKRQQKVIDRALTSKKAVVVKKGQYAGVSNNFKNATEPVKINPEQFTRLKLNSEFKEKLKISEKVFKKELAKTKQEFAKIEPRKDVGYDQKAQRFVPRSGGYLDVDTGVYVSPDKNAEFDQEAKVYKITEVKGDVKKNGNYKAPAGMQLTATSGFVSDNNSSAAKNLNESIVEQIVQPKDVDKIDIEEEAEDPSDESFYRYFQDPE